MHMSSVYSRRTFDSFVQTLATTTTADMLMSVQLIRSSSGPRLSSGKGGGQLLIPCMLAMMKRVRKIEWSGRGRFSRKDGCVIDPDEPSHRHSRYSAVDGCPVCAPGASESGCCRDLFAVPFAGDLREKIGGVVNVDMPPAPDGTSRAPGAVMTRLELHHPPGS